MKQKPKVIQIGIGHDHDFSVINTMRKNKDYFDFMGYVVLEEEESLFERKKDIYGWAKRLKLEEALEIKGPQGAFIETDDCNLTEYAYIAAKKGLSIHMDKPGGQDAEKFNNLIDYCKQNDIIFHTGYMYRYNPAVKNVIERIRKNEFGKIYYIEAQMNCFHPKEKRQWLRNYKGGMMNYLGCHLIDFVLQLQGRPKEIIPFNTSSGADNIDAEDCSMALLKYDSGISFVKATAIEAGGFMRRQLVICCEKATIEINPTERFEDGDKRSSDMYISTADKALNWAYRGDKIHFKPFDRYNEMLIEFADIINGKKQNPYSYEYEKLVHNVLLNACGIKCNY